MTVQVEIRVPDLGDFKEVAVIDILVKVGDVVEIDTPLVTLETEKATMDVPSSAAGRVEALHLAKGGKVKSGDLVAVLSAACARRSVGTRGEHQPHEQHERSHSAGPTLRFPLNGEGPNRS